MSFKYHFQTKTQQWVDTLKHSPIKGDLRMKASNQLFLYDGAQWRPLCPKCNSRGRPIFCITHNMNKSNDQKLETMFEQQLSITNQNSSSSSSDDEDINNNNNNNRSTKKNNKIVTPPLACQFFDRLSEEWQLPIIHKHRDPTTGEASGCEFMIQNKWKVDGVVANDNIIIEFLGDFWHGNLERYEANAIQPKSKQTFQSLWYETCQRFEQIRLAGYRVFYVWEMDFLTRKSLATMLLRPWANASLRPTKVEPQIIQSKPSPKPEVQAMAIENYPEDVQQ